MSLIFCYHWTKNEMKLFNLKSKLFNYLYFLKSVCSRAFLFNFYVFIFIQQCICLKQQKSRNKRKNTDLTLASLNLTANHDIYKKLSKTFMYYWTVSRCAVITRQI